MKNLFFRILAFFLLVIFSPLFIILYFLVKKTSKGSFLFKQLRAGKDKKPFLIYKIRTMVDNAESIKPKIKSLNEVDGPVFKIYNDPRFTKVGKFLSHAGLDELPQLINIIKGEMDFVGPRPLPIEEAVKIPKKYEKRFSVLPGITSPWVLQGAHKLSFDQWMESDLDYIKNKSFWYDLVILGKSVFLILKLISKNIIPRKNEKK